jgi:hypothetical protein
MESLQKLLKTSEEQRNEFEKNAKDLGFRLEEVLTRSFRAEKEYQETINQLKKEKELSINVESFQQK